MNFKNILFFFVFFIVPAFCTFVAVEQSTLKMVNVMAIPNETAELFRHGDRTPINHFPTDPYKDPKFWSEKPGQLTKQGKHTEYMLGKWLRTRYPNLVGDKFDPDETHIISTDIDRTLMSAQCVAAAFFYPKNAIRFQKDLPWTPIPIHTSPAGDDLLLSVDKACPRIQKEEKIMLKTKEMVDYRKKFNPVFEKLTKFTGKKMESFLDVDYIFDTLHIELMHNYTLPPWTKLVYGKMKEISAIGFKMNTFTHELKRLRGGPLLGKITTDMLNKSRNANDTKRLFMYSAHDTTVASLLNTMGVYQMTTPNFGSVVIWELHHEEGKGHFVRLFYQNDSKKVLPAYQLVIPGCTEDCPLDQWESILKEFIPTDWNSECFRPDANQYKAGIITILGASGLFAIVLIILFVYNLQLEKKIHKLTNVDPISVNVHQTYGSTNDEKRPLII